MIYPKNEGHFTRWKDGTYQRNLYNAALMYVSNRRIALDVGAHVGIFTNYMVADFKGIIALEPIPENVECFYKNVTSPKVLMLTIAAWKYPTVLNLGMEYKGNSGSWTATKQITATRSVLGLDVDNLCLGNLDLVKLDIQGAEYEALLGMKKTLEINKPTILIESRDLKVHKLLLSWGYVPVAAEFGREDFIYIHCSVNTNTKIMEF